MEYQGDRYAQDNQYKVSQAMLQAQMNQKPYEWRARKGSQLAPLPPSGMNQLGGMIGLGALSLSQGQAQRDLLKKYQTPATVPPMPPAMNPEAPQGLFERLQAAQQNANMNPGVPQYPEQA
jgi:hypothetical protein